MVWCGSTEMFIRPGEIHQSLEAFEKALDEDHDQIAPSMLYAYAALMEGVPYANGAPNLSVDFPAHAGAGRAERGARGRQGLQDRARRS